MPLTICQTFKICSQEIFKWITKQNSVNEESISDWLMYKLNDLNSNIKSIQFNRFEESHTTGADYELWVINHTNANRYRIQAKRLRTGQDQYYGIAYTNKSGMQIEKLIIDAEKKDYIPLYSFYNNENIYSKCAQNIKNEGVYIADAYELFEEIINKPKTHISSDFLISKSVPISCLFCCPLTHYFNNRFIERYLNKDSSKQGIYSLENLPNYVNTILNSKQKNIEEWFKKEFSYDLNNVCGLIVIDNRNRNKNII